MGREELKSLVGERDSVNISLPHQVGEATYHSIVTNGLLCHVRDDASAGCLMTMHLGG